MLVPFVVNEDITIKEIAAALNKYFDADHTRKLVDGNYYCKEHLGSFFKGIQTDVHCLCSLADWTNNILHNRKMPDKVAEWALADETPQRLPVLADCITKIKDYLTLHANVLNEIKKLGEIDEKEFFGQNIKDAEISKLRTKYNKCVEQLDYVFLWNDYCKTKDKAIQLGLSDVISAIENRHVAPEGSISTLTYGIYNSMARELVRKEPSLSSFTTASYENIRARFIELDRKIMGIVREEIAFKISQRHVPQGNGIGPVST